LEFDVTADGWHVRGLKTGQSNQGCTPPAHLWGYSFDLASYETPIAADGRFAIEFPFTGWVDFTDPSGSARDTTTGHFAVTGNLTGSSGIGNLQVSTNFVHFGRQYACGTGLQTWIVASTG
jgi:hypothetical protein